MPASDTAPAVDHNLKVMERQQIMNNKHRHSAITTVLVALLYLQIMNMTPSGTKLPCTSQIIPFWQTSIFAQGEKS